MAESKGLRSPVLANMADSSMCNIMILWHVAMSALNSCTVLPVCPLLLGFMQWRGFLQLAQSIVVMTWAGAASIPGADILLGLP